MDITQTFYDKMAASYDKLFHDWEASVKEQALIIDNIFRQNGFENSASVLDCACGIGTQSIGLASLGYSVTGSDISEAELCEAKKRAGKNNVNIRFEKADFCALEDTFCELFDIVIAMDNALPHMLSEDVLKTAVLSISKRIKKGGMFVASIRDYDALIMDKPPYSPPYIHKTEKGKKVSFQTWDWEGDCYRLTQYIIADEEKTNAEKFECKYRAVQRAELTRLFISCGFKSAVWKFPDETGYYQPVMVARK